MKYKVGDKVQIKSEEWIYNNVGIPHVLAYLLEYAGKYAKITRVSKSDNPKYRIDIDYGEFEWFDLLLKKILLQKHLHCKTFPKQYENKILAYR